MLKPRATPSSKLPRISANPGISMATARTMGGRRAGYFGSRGQRVSLAQGRCEEEGKQHKTCSGEEGSSQGCLEHESSCAKPCFYLEKERKWSPVISAALQSRSMQAIEKCCIKGPLFSLGTETSEKRLPWVLETHQRVPLPTAAFITNLQLIILILILPEHF